MEPIEKFLTELPLFKSFSSAELEKVTKQSQLRTYAPGEAIISFGQPGGFLGIVIEGEAEATVTGGTGEKRRLGLLRRGDLLGEMSLLTGEPTSADVIALEKCQVLLIPQEVFSTSLAANPDAVRIMARTLTERLRSRLQDEEAQAKVENARRSTPDPYGLQLSATKPAKILVMNCGSSSLKYSYFDTAEMSNNLEGMVERIGLEGTCVVSSSKSGETRRQLGAIDYGGAFRAVIDLTTAGPGYPQEPK